MVYGSVIVEMVMLLGVLRTDFLSGGVSLIGRINMI